MARRGETSSGVVQRPSPLKDVWVDHRGILQDQSGVVVNPADSIKVWSTTGTNGSAMVQEAADDAMAEGRDLLFGAGEFDFTSSGGPVCDTGPDMLNGGTASVAYKALAVRGAGRGLTRVHVGPNQKGFFFANATGSIGKGGGVSGLGIYGTGIGAGGIGIQMGGRSAVRSDLLEVMHVLDVEFDNLTSCLIADDVSGLDMLVVPLRFKYGFEWGYNVDGVRARVQAGFNDTNLNNVALTTTSGQNTISSVPAGVIARLQVGYVVNCPGVIPPRTYVGSIGASSITLVDHAGSAVNALASGAQTISFFVGRLICFGNRVAATAGSLYPSQGSPFVSPYWSTLFAAQGGRVAATNHQYTGLVGSVEVVEEMGGPSHGPIEHRHLYVERCNEGALMGDSASTLQPSGSSWEACYIGHKSTLTRSFWTVLATEQNFGLAVRDCWSDSESDDDPWLACAGGGGGARLSWENNQLLNDTRTVKLGSASDTFAAQPLVPPGGAMFLGSARRGDAVQAWLSDAWLYFGQDGLTVNLAGASKTISNPADRSYATGTRGKAFDVYVTAATGNTLTFGNDFLDTDGTTLGTVAAGTTGQSMVLRFIYDGTKFRLQNTPAWG